MQQVADRRLSEASRSGTEQDFTALLVALVQPGYRLACAMLHDAEGAKDVVQEASLTAWRKFGRLEDRTLVKSWFLGIVANECRNARRKKWVTGVALGLPSGLTVSSAEDHLVQGADLRRALLRLRHRDRLVVALFFYLDMPIEDVAVVVGDSVSATRGRLYRAIKRLRPDVGLEEALL